MPNKELKTNSKDEKGIITIEKHKNISGFYTPKIEYICSKIRPFIKMDKKYIDMLGQIFDKLFKLNVLLIGDTIIDEYYFTEPKGRAMKDPILSTNYVNHERYAGGILATANNISNFVDNVKLITLLGDKKRNEEFIISQLNKNIDVKFFTKKNSFTTIKRRFIDKLRNGKLFKIEFISDEPISKEREKEIMLYLEEELPKYDLVVVVDFGHGFISDNMIELLEKKSKFLCANIQTNSANMGFNYFTKYKHLDFITLNENELRLGTRSRFEPVMKIVKKFSESGGFKKSLITMGKDGAMYLNDGVMYESEALVQKVVDAVGAGDAVFAITSLLVYSNVEPKLIPFFANCIGGITVQIMGNKESVTKDKLINFINEIKKNGME